MFNKGLNNENQFKHWIKTNQLWQDIM